MEMNVCKKRIYFNQNVECLYLPLLIFVLVLSGCTKENSVDENSLDEYAKEIVVDGNLHKVISYDNLRQIERLTIKGGITYEDWNVLYEMALTGKLLYLDMREAVVIGKPGSEIYKDNVVPPYQFMESKSLQSVLLPKGLIGIGNKAFAACSNLNIVSFPTSLNYIGDEAFSNCSKFRKLELPQEIDSIGVRAFYKTPLTGEFVLPKGLRVVAKQAFSQTNFSSVIITHDVFAAKDIKMYTIDNNSVFASCKYLQEVVVDEGCTCLEMGFTNCELLTDIKLPSTLKYIGRDSKSTHNYIFKECTSLNSVKLPEGITHIGMYAFDSTSMQSLEIPATIINIGEYTFKNSNIPILKVNWRKPLGISKSTFDSFDFGKSALYVPKGSSSLYANHEYWGQFGKIIEF